MKKTAKKDAKAAAKVAENAAQEQGSLQVVTMNVADLKPYERNPRKNDKAVPQMVAAIQEFGFRIPVLAKSDGTVIDGHLRLKAAAQLQLTQVPVILCDDWTEAQVKAFRLLVNRSVAWAEWDEQLLKLELEDLQALSFNLDMTGFSAGELDLYLNGAQFGPGSVDEQGKLDSKKSVICPGCQLEFTP